MKLIPILLMTFLLAQGCALFGESTTAKQLSEGGVVQVEKSYYDPAKIIEALGGVHESLPENAKVETHGDAVHISAPNYYRVIYNSSRTLAEGEKGVGFEGEILMEENAKGWRIRVKGRGQQALVHSQDAVEADKARSKEAGKAFESGAKALENSVGRFAPPSLP